MMQNHTSTCRWQAANDNQGIEEPPSFIPARTILCANEDGDMAIMASASGLYGETALVNSGKLRDVLANFNVDYQAARCLGDLIPDFHNSKGWSAIVSQPGIPLLKQRAVIEAMAQARRVAVTALRSHKASASTLLGSMGLCASLTCSHPPASPLDFSTRIYVRAPIIAPIIPANDLF